MKIDFSQIVTAKAKAATALAEAKAQASEQLNAAIETVASGVTGSVPLTEKLSWGSKEVAARAVVAGDATKPQSAMIEAEARVTGEAVSTLARRVIRNADGYRAIIATLTGLRRHTETALLSATTLAEVDAVFTDAVTRLSVVGRG